MRKITIDFVDNKIKLEFPGQKSEEYWECGRFKERLCTLINLPPCTRWVELDFDEEIVSWVTTTTMSLLDSEQRPGLAAQEGAILKAIGLEPVDITNSVGLVEALINGKISDTLFQTLMEIECMDKEQNRGIKSFLSALLGADSLSD